MISKIYALLFGLLVAIPSAFAFNLDVTDDPNVDFFVGYKKKYGPDCEIGYWQSRWETSHLMSPDECSNITPEQVYKDIIAEMQKIKKISNAQDFISYYSELERHKKEALEHQFCLNKFEYVLIFTRTEVDGKPGWNYVGYSKFSRYRSVNKVIGSWKKLDNNHVLADFGNGIVTVDKSEAISC